MCIRDSLYLDVAVERSQLLAERHKFAAGDLSLIHISGSDPDVGKRSAEESRNDIAKSLEDADMVFLSLIHIRCV